MMANLLRNRITYVWLALVLATCLSFDASGLLSFLGGARTLGAVVLAIAFLKVRYIMLEFMELRGAPWTMRLIAEGWCVLVCVAVIVFYLGRGWIAGS